MITSLHIYMYVCMYIHIYLFFTLILNKLPNFVWIKIELFEFIIGFIIEFIIIKNKMLKLVLFI